ncbi:hypothetical protein AnigIFM63326_001873 [Aspergillus niger]|nr:hypothetical protein AnigIFM63326_001873 [Aspergillus niger]
MAKKLHDNVSGLEDINAQPRVAVIKTQLVMARWDSLAAKVVGADPLRAIEYDRLWIRPGVAPSYYGTSRVGSWRTRSRFSANSYLRHPSSRYLPPQVPEMIHL